MSIPSFVKSTPGEIVNTKNILTLSNEFYLWKNFTSKNVLQNVATGEKKETSIITDLPYFSKYYTVGDIMILPPVNNPYNYFLEDFERFEMYSQYPLYRISEWEQEKVPRSKKNQLLFEKKIYEEITLYLLFILAIFFLYGYISTLNILPIFGNYFTYITFLSIFFLLFLMSMNIANIRNSFPQRYRNKSVGNTNSEQNSYFNTVNYENSTDGNSLREKKKYDYIKLEKLTRNTTNYRLSENATVESLAGKLYSTVNLKTFKLVATFEPGFISWNTTDSKHEYDPTYMTILSGTDGFGGATFARISPATQMTAIGVSPAGDDRWFIKIDDNKDFNPFKYTYPYF